MSTEDWILDILVCPECGSPLLESDNSTKLVCTGPTCGYHSERRGNYLNLLPFELDQHQRAEHEFRVKGSDRFADQVRWMDAETYRRFKLFNHVTYYSFTSQYFFFRDEFIRRHTLKGRGLEIGSGFCQQSGFIKFFYPETEMVATDVAPYNIEMGSAIADWLGFQTDFFVLADAERLPFLPESFDFLFSSGMLHHLGDLKRALDQGFKALKPGGRWYIVNELAIGKLPQIYWNSRFGQKGQQAQQSGIRENSYTFREWQEFLSSSGFRIVETHFHRNPYHKMESWPRAAYYALLARLPLSWVKMGLPCEVNFVLEKSS